MPDTLTAAAPSLTWTGCVAHLHITPRAFLPMRAMEEIELVPGIGILGDRYALDAETGFHSHKKEPGRDVTLLEEEALEDIRRDYGVVLLPEEHRRNVTTRGVPLNHLVGKRFWLGAALLECTRLSKPCAHIEEVTGKKVFDPMVHRSGINCRVIEGGKVRLGDIIRPA